MLNRLLILSVLCITGFHNFCYGQADSLMHKPFWGPSSKYRTKTGVNFYVGYLNDFGSNPAVTAYYGKYNLSVNRQYSFIGNYYLSDEYNLRANFKLKKYGGFSLRYQDKTLGWYDRKTTALAYNYSVNSKMIGLFSFAFEACALRRFFDRSAMNLSPGGYASSAIMVPDFNAGFIYSKRNFIAEGLCSHLLEPNISFYKTPGNASNLQRNYFARLSYVITGGGRAFMPIAIVPGVSWSRVENHTKILSGLCTVDYDLFAVTVEVSSDKSWETRLTFMNKLNKYRKSHIYNQLRLNMSYRKYVSLSNDYGTQVGEFRFGLNYNFGKWDAQPRHIDRF